MKTLSTIVAAALIIFLSACSNQMQKDQEMVAKNKEVMKQIMETFTSGNMDNIGNYISENVVEHTPDPMIQSTGLQQFKDASQMYRTAFPDMKMEVVSMVAEGDKVTALVRMTGTHSGPLGQMVPTNKSFDVTGVDVVRFENGKGVEHWGYWQETKMMTQLGWMPDHSKMAEGQQPEASKEQEKK